MSKDVRCLMVFVDGLGIGEDDPKVNPLARGHCPFVHELVQNEGIPLDCGLGVPGLPQSATGQTVLLTGLNAPQILGRHEEGFPGRQLRPLIQKHNIFSRLLDAGRRPAFANAYFIEDWTDPRYARMQSVTTVSNLAAFGRVRTMADMESGEAVYQDLTRESLRGRGYKGPLTNPHDSGIALREMAARYDFTLFEYFQTDRMAHRGSEADVARVLEQFDAFLVEATRFAEQPGHVFLLVSDHGNIEDCRSLTHTQNPVPLVVRGASDGVFSNATSLLDVFPGICTLLVDYRSENFGVRK
jgi:hypothetical protein